MAVAPNAAPWVPVESSAAAKMKHNDKPEADIMSRARRPYLSTVCETVSESDITFDSVRRTQRGMNDATMYVQAVAPPRISDRFLDRPMVF